MMKDGVFRGFAFVGFREPEYAEKAVKRCHQTYFDTRKMVVEIAQAIGSTNMSRPWSKYAYGSSQHRKMYPEQYAHEQKQKEEEEELAKNAKGKKGKKDSGASSSNKAMEMYVDAKSNTKSKTWANDLIGEDDADEAADVAADSEDEDGAVADLTSNAKDSVKRDTDAFDDDLDDMAFLKSKATNLADAFDSDEDDEKLAEEDLVNDSEKSSVKQDKGKKKKAVFTEVEQEIEKEEEDSVGSTGRLYITNLPYSATDEDITNVFATYGPLADCHIVRDEEQGTSRGMAYCTYVFPEHAVEALGNMDGASFQGRVVRVAPAKPREEKAKDEKLLSKSKTYKKQKEEKMRKEASKAERTWNLLFVSANAATDALASEMGVDKRELLDTANADSNLAVRVALTETHIIKNTKQWLAKEGIRVGAFERVGSSMLNASAKYDRSKDTIIVKHLPSDTNSEELSEWFARFGTLVRFCLAPSKTVAVVQFSDPKQAEFAFGKIAFKRYKHVPMMLEWAPIDVFTGAKEVKPGDKPTNDEDEAEVDQPDEKDESEDEEEESTVASLFVKNLSFNTTDAKFAKQFEKLPGFRKAVIMKKKQASGDSLSMGYGFVEFKTQQQALAALKKRQGMSLDGHVLSLQQSQRQATTKKQESTKKSSKSTKAGSKKLTSPKLAIRNVPFEVNKRELTQLFGAYGHVTSVRLPKKVDGSSHRGFAFIEFLTKAEASAAMEALQHTHLYGRHLVIEPAEVDKTANADEVREATLKRTMAHANSESSKRRQKNAVFDDKSFGKAMGIDE